MKSVTSLLSIVRWKNLLLLLTTQVFFYRFLFKPLLQYGNDEVSLNAIQLFIIIFSSVCVAAAGYIWNDVYDIHTDRLYKSDRVLVKGELSVMKARYWAGTLCLLGLLSAAVLSFILREGWIWLGFSLPALFLWLYSKYIKSWPLAGHILISLLSVHSILMVALCEKNVPTSFLFSIGIKMPFLPISFSMESVKQVIGSVLEISLMSSVYAAFIFLNTMIREMVKAMEDREGDRLAGRKTLAVIFSYHLNLIFIQCLNLVSIMALAFCCYYAFHMGWMRLLVYIVLTLMLPHLVLCLGLFKRDYDRQLYQRSSWLLKILMVTGIFSLPVLWLEFFYF